MPPAGVSLLPLQRQLESHDNTIEYGNCAEDAGSIPANPSPAHGLGRGLRGVVVEWYHVCFRLKTVRRIHVAVIQDSEALQPYKLGFFLKKKYAKPGAPVAGYAAGAPPFLQEPT